MTPEPSEIIRQTAERHGLDPRELMHGSGARRSVSAARSEAMAIMRAELQMNFTAIGRAFGGYPHTTVIYMLRRYDGGIDKHPKMPRRHAPEEVVTDIAPADVLDFDPSGEQERLSRLLGKAYDPGYHWRSNRAGISALSVAE